MSRDKIVVDNPSLLAYNGPGNLTMTNYVVTDFYATIVKVAGTIVDTIFPFCTPDDDLNRVSILDHGFYSLKGNMNVGVRMNTLALLYSLNHYRPQTTYVSNHYFDDYEIPPVPPVFVDGSSMDDLYYSDSVHRNYIPMNMFIDLTGYRKVIFNNLTFSGVPQANSPAIRITGVNHFELTSINFKNYNGSISSSIPVITLTNGFETNTIIHELNIQN